MLTTPTLMLTPPPPPPPPHTHTHSYPHTLTTPPHSYFLHPHSRAPRPSTRTHHTFTLVLPRPHTHAHHTPTLVIPCPHNSFSPHPHTRTSTLVLADPHPRAHTTPTLVLTHTSAFDPYHDGLRGSISEYKCVNSLYSVSCRILLQYLRMNNRIMFIVALLISVAAAVLLADWQSLPYDPCTEFSLYYHPELVERYKQEIKNSSGLVPRDISLEHYGGLLWEKSADGTPLYSVVNETPSAIVSHHPSANRINKEVIDLAVNKCESLYTSLHCHWTPMSLITGKDCPDCRLLCRSVDKTLNFIQFCLGAALLLISVPSVRVSLVNVITDYVNKQIQVSDEIALISASNTLGF